MIGVRLPEQARITSMYFGGNSFIMTPPFSPSAICVTSGGIEMVDPVGPVTGCGRRPRAS